MSNKKRIKALEKENKELKDLLFIVKEQLQQLKEDVKNINTEVHHHYHYDTPSTPSLEPPYIVTCGNSTGKPMPQEPSTTEPINFSIGSLVNSDYIIPN